MIRTLLLLPACLLCVACGGCSRADLFGAERIVPGPPDAVASVVKRVLTDEDLVITVDTPTLVEGRYLDGTEVAVDIRSLGDAHSEITVDVGAIGQGRSSERLADLIVVAARDQDRP